MEKKISTRQTPPAEEPESPVSATPVENTNAPTQVDPQYSYQYLQELRELTNSLLESVSTVQKQNALQAALQNTIDDVKSDVKAARAMLVSSATAGTVARQSAGTESCRCSGEEAGCPPCECVSSKCCCYDVIMTHFQVVHMQLEPTDTNAVPTNVLELRFFASIDPIHNIGAIIPDPTGWVTGHKGILEPVGMWVPVHRFIGTKCFAKGSKEQLTIELIVLEVETPIESAVLNRDEYGSASETITLDCCCNNYPPIIIPVALTGGGLNLAPGVINAKFAIVKKC